MSPAASLWRRWIRFVLLAAGLSGAVACSNSEATYSFEIRGPLDVFHDAKSVSLYQNNKLVSTSAVSGGAGFSLEVGNLDPLAGGDPVVFSIKAFDAANALIAYGEAPGVEILPQDNQLRIFVQKPGSLVPVADLEVKLKDHVAFESETVSSSTTNYHVTAAVFGLGTIASGALSGALYVYNPLLLQVEKIGDLSPARTAVARAESPSLSHGDNPLLFFSGIDADGNLTDRLDELIILRTGLAQFSVANSLKVALPAGFARAGGVLGTTYSGTVRMVFGGRDAAGAALASVVAVDERSGTPMYISNHPPMAAARDGHTVTVDPASTGTDNDWGRVLIYGGAAPGTAAPVAELLNPKTQTWLPLPAIAPAGATLQAHPGTGRHGHQALILPSKSAKGSMQVLIVGGYDDANVVRGDSVLCIPAEAICSDAGLRLSEPRARFAAFVVKDDLVVIGGVNAAGAPIGSAETFSASTLAPIAKITSAVPRIGPTATALGNGMTVVIGGEGADGAPLGAVEIYQPHRTE